MRALGMAVLPLLLAVLLLAANAKNIPTFAGPYLVHVDKVYVCEVNGSASGWEMQIRTSHFSPARPYDVQTVTGFVNVSTAFDDRWWASVEVSTRSANQWKPNAFLARFPTQGCTAFRTQWPSVFRALYSEAGEDVMTGRAPCRLPVRTYRFDHKPVSWAMPSVPVVPYGFYRFTLVYGVGPHAKLCIRGDGHVVPRP